MFTSTIDPILLHLGPVQIRYYGLVYAFGFLLAMYMFRKWSKELKISIDQADDLAFWLAFGAVIGGRLFEVLVWEPAYYLSNPLKIIAFWEGGMAFHGGLIGVCLALFLYCKKYNINILKLADKTAPWACLVLGLGRLANFANGEIVGRITDVSWCVNFPGVEGCRHPYQIYSALKRFAVGIISSRLPKHKDGYIFWSTVLMLNAGRFVLDFLRDDQSNMWGPLSTGQWVSLGLSGISLYYVYKSR